ncbi:hypothetical protein ETB97_004178 [Aspergillus alliaceus]|uniref:Uncharacterized protein n=1 Tax=Petromyces alliaceus TaxID=209559 RepID=A0A8H6EAC0_PETAA|nr:hypothetical protein ETB97_004178 [Aspergillus burnettii]
MGGTGPAGWRGEGAHREAVSVAGEGECGWGFDDHSEPQGMVLSTTPGSSINASHPTSASSISGAKATPLSSVSSPPVFLILTVTTGIWAQKESLALGPGISTSIPSIDPWSFQTPADRETIQPDSVQTDKPTTFPESIPHHWDSSTDCCYVAIFKGTTALEQYLSGRHAS